MSNFPQSIREINALPDAEKHAIYHTLIPSWVFEEFDIDTTSIGKHQHIQYLCPTGSRAMEITVKRDPAERDPLLYFNMADTFNQQLLVLLVIVNNPDAPRFNVDIDEYGNRTNFGTSSRNIPAEIAAKKAGLAPGQVREGLRAFRRSLPILEQFVDNMGHDMFMIEPLAYHNAVVFERYGFNYIRGYKDMQKIHAQFQPDGDLHTKLEEDHPFRPLNTWKNIRGRSWAIHDGILGHPFTGFQMYKRIDRDAGLNSFPDAKW